MSPAPIMSSNVAASYANFPTQARLALEAVRARIFEVAASNPAVGEIDETLKWGEPAYLTPQTNSGSTIRLGWKPAMPDHGAIYLNCQTTLIADMRNLYPSAFEYQGKRAALFSLTQPPEPDILSHCIEMALTYHSRKKRTK